MRLKMTLMSICLMALLPAQAQSLFREPADRNDPLSMFKMAGISRGQELKMRILLKAAREDLVRRGRVLAVLLQEMRGLSLQPDPDPKIVLARQEEINKASGDLNLERVKLTLHMRAILTPGQREKYARLLKESSAGQAGVPGQAIR